MRVPSIVVFCALCCGPATSFVAPSSRIHVSRWEEALRETKEQTQLSMETKEAEKILRKEIDNRNSILDGEEHYARVDGEGVAALAEEVEIESTVEAETEDHDSWEMQMKKLTTKRPYLMFLLEKTIETGEKAIDDLFDGGKIPLSGKKERIVVLGTGWGAASLLKDIDTDLYDVTIVSPRNYFVFTPMLAGASVGSVEYRSITEPVRQINRKADYLEGTATGIDPKAKTISCESVTCVGNSCEINNFTVEYDRLVMTVGAQTNTFGIPGVREHCNFLKQIQDARGIRTAIVNCFERANLPGMTDKERVKTLTFAVIGAGPTGIEFAAELRDFIEEDGPKYYPNLLKFVRIKVIEATSSVLAPFDKSLQAEAISRMNRRIQKRAAKKLLPPDFKLVELLLDSSVKEITDQTIFLNDGNAIDYGLSVWAAGNGPLPFTLEVIEQLGEAQKAHQKTARGRIATDPWLRAEGSEGTILSFGDCSFVLDAPDGFLPATAQVAAQQGEYLAKLLNAEYEISPPPASDGTFLPPRKNPKHQTRLSESIVSLSTKTEEYAKPFQFLNLGILAYTGGDSALVQVSTFPNSPPIKATGKIGNALWRSVYFSKQVSSRNRLLVFNDWIKRRIFGRDITRI